MNSTSFYNFDVTSGSSIQANALFDIFDDLSSIGIGIRLNPKTATDKSYYTGRTTLDNKEDP